MKIIQIVPLDRKCTLGVTPALGDAHCTGGMHTVPEFGALYRGLCTGTGVCMHWYRGL